MNVLDIVLFYTGLLVAASLVFWLGTECGRYLQATRDRREWTAVLRDIKEIKHAMANFDALKDEIARAIAYIQQATRPKPEDPAIQAGIDDLAAQLKAATDAASQPPA